VLEFGTLDVARPGSPPAAPPTGSAWLGVPYDASVFRPNKVGTMRLAFVDQNTATMTWTMFGITRTSTIKRQAY